MARKEISASDALRKLYPDEGMAEEFSREITIQSTEACNLACSYCYQHAKTPLTMSWETGKKIIDFLFKMWDDNDPKGFINHKTKQVILDFIGGEPMLQVKLMDKICEYFWTECIKRRHVWAETFMISMASNGTIYFTDDVQHFLNKYKGHISYSVSIDGPKEMHDACRVFPDGRGSFDLAKAAQDDYNKNFHNTIGTKATIARANLPYLSTLIKYYVGQGFTSINANTVYEEEWNYDDAKLFYSQLKEIADYILEQAEDIEISLFEENFFKPMDEEDNRNWCGGTGAMLAFDPLGNAFPCIRYMHSSLADDQPPLCIGNLEDGIYNTEETKQIGEMFDKITRRSQSTDECFYCPVAAGCSWCSGWNYQLYGTPDKRCTRICNMHQARSLGNVYYWNKKYQKEGLNKVFKRYLPDDIALKIIDEKELQLLNEIEKRVQ